VWAFGACLYWLLYNRTPFSEVEMSPSSDDMKNYREWAARGHHFGNKLANATDRQVLQEVGLWVGLCTRVFYR
jgi:hypothetical protein